MPFNPEIPRENTEQDAREVRENFNALKAMIDAVPAGPPGSDGRDGIDGQSGRDGVDGTPGPEGRGIASVDDNGAGLAIIHMSDGALYGPFTVASGPQGQQGPPGPNFAMRGDWDPWTGYNRGDVVACYGDCQASGGWLHGVFLS